MTTELKVLGYQGDWIIPEWPALTLEEADRILQRFPKAGGARQLLFQSPRPFSAASLVATPRGNYFVKRHHASIRDRKGLMEEHGFLAHLRSKGGKVAEVLKDIDGESAICDGDWTYEVHSVAPGLDLYCDEQSWTPFRSMHQAYAAGRALAELHYASEGYQAPPREARSLVTSFSIFSQAEPLLSLERYIASRPELLAYLERKDWKRQTTEILLPFHEELKPWLRFLNPLWTHNDLHGSNLLWSSDSPDANVTCVIDFGLSDRTNAAHDIATAIERFGIEWLAADEGAKDVVHFGQIGAFLEGYEDLRPLHAEEAEAVAALLPLVHTEFALSEADYFLKQLRSPEKADLAWDGYFLGHAKWFRTQAGQKLMSYLCSWAKSPRTKSEKNS